MNFNNFQYETKDGVFKILEMPQTLSSELILDQLNQIKPNYPHWCAKDITDNKITVYNTVTNRFSDKSLYVNKQGKFYFKGQILYDKPLSKTKRYYLDELIQCQNESNKEVSEE